MVAMATSLERSEIEGQIIHLQSHSTNPGNLMKIGPVPVHPEILVSKSWLKISKYKLHRLTERDSRLAHYFGVWGYDWAI